MSWHYSQEQEADFSLQTYLDGIRSERSRSSDTHAKSYYNDNEMGCLNHSQSGTMCEPSTVAPGVDSLMLFQEDSPAKTSALRVKVRDLPETVVGFGLSICGSLRRYGLTLSSRKTVRTCVPVASAPSSKDLPAWGMTYGGVCWELGMSVRITRETECGYWPTPTKTNAWGNLENAVWRGAAPYVNGVKKNTDLKAYLLYLDRQDLSESPTFREWLMGWPIGWTDLKPLETGRTQ